ncbi:MAG: protein phosphatase 2C domain-containing protein [Mucilaginibacter sp.]
MADQFFGITDTGKARDNNEDTFIAEPSANNQYIIACVIDGLGGYSGGEVAAAVTRETILQRLKKPSGEINLMLLDCFDQANERILEERKLVKDHHSMGCVLTLALVDISNNQFYYAHVGDTRLYLLRDKSLVKISHDQSFVGFLEESGRLSEEDAMNHPKRNEINKALGFESGLSKNTDYIETGQSPFLSGDMLLLCSDGLTDMVDSAEITAILTKEGSLKTKGQQLIDAANKHGGKDNITVVLVQNDKVPPQHEVANPAVNIKRAEPIKAEPEAKPIEKSVAAPTPGVGPAKSNSALIAVLSILLLIFLASSIYLFLQNKTPAEKQPAALVVKAANPQELKLQRAINAAKGHTLILYDTAYTSPVIITKAIQIEIDTLLIKAKGKIVLQSDSSYKGAAFVLAAKCKSVVLDSLSFSNFSSGISSYNNSLTLKNVRFVNCPQGIQNVFAFTDGKYISGQLPVAAFRSDSVPVITKPK